MFTRRGVVAVEIEETVGDELLEQVVEAGGDDYIIEENTAVIFTEPEAVSAVGRAMEDFGYVVLSAQPEQVPSTYTALTDDEHIKKMTTLLDMLEDNDDVQEVWHNWEM